MAKMTMELPKDIMADIKKIHDNADQIFGAMTDAGADVVMENIKANVPPAVRDSEMMECLKKTKVYKTPSDDGINTKVGFYGYFRTKEGRTVAAPLVANVYEYGRSNAPFPKHPFLRKSFREAQIKEAMLKAQKEASGGILDE